MRAITFTGSLALQCGAGIGLICLGLLVPVAPPEIPDLRILAPSPRFRDAVKIITTSVGTVGSTSAVSRMVPRVFQDNFAQTFAKPAASVAAFGEMPLTAVGTAIDGIVGSVVGAASTATLPPPVEVNRPDPPASIRVGGDVLAAKILHRVQPVYPALARAVRVEGVVRLLGVLNREGRIESLQVLSGHPLLVQAALEAVRQWIYSPTYLNGAAVAVQAPIEVRFNLLR